MMRSGRALDGVDVGRGDHLVDLVPAQRTKPPSRASSGIAPRGLGVAGSAPRRRPALGRRAARQRSLQQATAPSGISRGWRCTVPGMAPRCAAARLVVGRPARARVVGLLRLPGDDAALDVIFHERTGAVHAVRAAHHLVVRPAVAVGVLPGAGPRRWCGDRRRSTGELFLGSERRTGDRESGSSGFRRGQGSAGHRRVGRPQNHQLTRCS